MVVDSSPKPIDVSVMKEYGALPGRDVEYHHWPNMPWPEVMVKALSMVDTKWSLKFPDDDLFCNNAVRPILEFLEDHPTMVSATGQEVAMWDTHGGYETFEFVLESQHKSSFSSELWERCHHSWEWTECKLHNIIRTDVHLAMWQFFLDFPDLWAIRYSDKLFNYIIAVHGNSAIIPSVFSHMRSQESAVGRLVFEPKLQKEIKGHLKFNVDFPNHDLTPLADLAGVSVEDVKSLWSGSQWVDNSYRKSLFDQVNTLYTMRGPIFSIGDKIIYPREGPGASRTYADSMAEMSTMSDYPESLYPIYNKAGTKGLAEIIASMREVPLQCKSPA